ncbi:hypothetical protein TcasGA2_TC004894 [Tribolium castaneum]|uniref:Uncharacterized protein n=1 Tax=Tribolium castaneum TaxID=7070 RepID=D6WCG8_TRICA|nr:hypothetical protein TcasGA2_TC004894 [Tribolium castaneum]
MTLVISRRDAGRFRHLLSAPNNTLYYLLHLPDRRTGFEKNYCEWSLSKEKIFLRKAAELRRLALKARCHDAFLYRSSSSSDSETTLLPCLWSRVKVTNFGERDSCTGVQLQSTAKCSRSQESGPEFFIDTLQ